LRKSGAENGGGNQRRGNRGGEFFHGVSGLGFGEIGRKELLALSVNLELQAG